MKTLSPKKILVFFAFSCIGAYVIDIDRHLLGFIIMITGCIAFWTIDHKVISPITRKYGGREVELYLLAGSRIKGKVVRSDDPDILSGCVLIKDSRLTSYEENDDEPVIREEEITDIIEVDADQIYMIVPVEMDKVPSVK